MKYQLLWTACVIGLLQLSVVTCRRAHDKVTNKENEEYSTTVSPPVAYTGQEIERALNSSDKLALDPGAMSSDTYHYEFDWSLYVLIVFVCCVLVFLLYGCIAIYYRHRRVRPGMILSNTGQSKQLPSPTVPHHQPTNELPLAYVCQQCQSQPPSQYQPVQHLPGYQYQSNQLQNLPPTAYQAGPEQAQNTLVSAEHQVLSAESQNKPTATEFENPLSSLKQP